MTPKTQAIAHRSGHLTSTNSSRSGNQIIFCSLVSLVLASCNPLPFIGSSESNDDGGIGGSGGQDLPDENICGDGVIAEGEACDDGNQIENDGCRANCTIKSGYQCSGQPSDCADIDECALGVANCYSTEICTNTPGSYVCSCATGFKSNNIGCVDIDECWEVTHNCDFDAKCTNTPGSFTCACYSGFEGDGTICTDIDECATGSANCSPMQSCTNTNGSFYCSCFPGFELQGSDCVDIDECTANLNECKNRTCTNTPGGYDCGGCLTGYADCDVNPANGCEVDLNRNETCGGCNNVCNGGVCVAQACIATSADTASIAREALLDCAGNCPWASIDEIVARADGSISGIGWYEEEGGCVFPDQSDAPGWQDQQELGPNPISIDVDPMGNFAPPLVIDYVDSYLYYQPYRIYSDTASGPAIWPVGGGVGYYYGYYYEQSGPLPYEKPRQCYGSTLSTSTFSITPGCAKDIWQAAGNDVGQVVIRNESGVTTYDSTGQAISLVPDPFNTQMIPAFTHLTLGAQNELHTGFRMGLSIWLGKGNAAGILEWGKTIQAPYNNYWQGSFDFDVDIDGNTLIAMTSDATIDLGNGPLPAISVQDLILGKFDPQGNVLWAKRFGGPGFEAKGVKLRRTGTHDFAIIADFSGALDLGDRLLGPARIVAKFDAAGEIVWHARTNGRVLSGHPSGAVYVDKPVCGFGLTKYNP